MTYPIVSAAPRTAKRMFVVLASAATLVTAAATGALAQAQPPAQQRPAAPAPRQATPPRPAQPAPAAQQQRPASPGAQQQPQQQAGNGGEAPQLIFSPWVKLCNKDADPKAKRVCVTVKDGRVESGLLVVSVAVIEMDGEPK